MKKNIQFLVIALFLAAFSAQAQEKLSLEKAISLALEKNYSIQISRNDAVVSQKNVTLGNAGILPQVTGTVGETQSLGNPQNVFSGGIALNWTIFDGMLMFVNYDKLKTLKTISDVNLKYSIERNVSQVVLAYYGVTKQTEILKALRENITISEERLRLAKDRFSVGSGSKLEQLQALTNLNEDKSSLVRQEIAVSNAKIVLNQIIGREIEADYLVNDSIPVLENISSQEMQSSSLKNNPTIVLAEQNTRIAQSSLDSAQTQYYPKVNLNFGYSFSQFGTPTATQSGMIYGVGLNWSIFDGLNTDRKKEIARTGISSAELRLQSAKDSIDAEITKAFNNYHTALQILKMEEENIAVAKQVVQISVEKMRVGTITQLELRDAQQILLNSENRLISTRFDAKTAETDLLRLSGQLVKNK